MPYVKCPSCDTVGVAAGRNAPPGGAAADRQRQRREPVLRVPFAGYDASVNYVVNTLEAAGYDPTAGSASRSGWSV